MIGVYIMLGLLGVLLVYRTRGNNSYLDEFKKFVTSQHKVLEDRRTAIEAEISKSITDSVAIVESAKTLAQATILELESAELAKRAEFAEKTIAKYSDVERDFRARLKDDVTLDLVASAYAFVRLGLQPRDIKEAELIKAVITHQRSLPSYQASMKDELPQHDGLN